jgi:hypothetical protein
MTENDVAAGIIKALRSGLDRNLCCGGAKEDAR